VFRGKKSSGALCEPRYRRERSRNRDSSAAVSADFNWGFINKAVTARSGHFAAALDAISRHREMRMFYNGVRLR
jgi:hypothetical protein